MNFIDIAILNLWGVDYHSHIKGNNNSEAINSFKNADLIENKRSY